MPIAAASVLAQTVRDLELVLVLDGPVDGAAPRRRRHRAADDRVRVVERPKGRRHGEETKAEAIAGAAADVIAYCGDDDLWLPWHLETLLPHVEGARAGAGPLAVRAGAGRTARCACCPSTSPSRATATCCSRARTASGRRRPCTPADALDGTSGWAVPDEGPADLWLWRQVVVRPDVRLTSVRG